MPTTQQIINNQETYKDNIFSFLTAEIKQVKHELRTINSSDEFIMKEKEKLMKRFKKTNTLESIKKYFFLSKKRDDTFYIWWDDSIKEAIVKRYDKK